jgi:phosphoglycerate dehydrogenase-like enzyme
MTNGPTRRPAVAVLLHRGEAPPAGLHALAETAEILLVDDPERSAADLRRAEIVFAWAPARTGEALAHAHSVRWIHAGSLGVDAILREEGIPADVHLTNTRGVFERPIAEYVLGLLLLFVKHLHTTLARQGRRKWDRRDTEMLLGRRLAILGAGGIGRELAVLARATGMDVQVVARSSRAGDRELGPVRGLAEADDVLAQAEFLVLALPLTATTRGLLDADLLDRLREGVRIVNVGRGATVEEPALLAALRSGHVAGAALDVFADEPLPDDHPFWRMEQVVVSPHMSGERIGWEEAVVRGFAENLSRWRSEEPLVNLVDVAEFSVPGTPTTGSGVRADAFSG